VIRVLLPCLVLLLAAPAQAQDSDEARAQEYILDAADLLDAGRCPEALGQLESALRLPPAARRAWLFKAQCHVQLNEWEDAATALDRFDSFELTARESVEAGQLRDLLPPSEDPAPPTSLESAADPAPTSPSDSADEALYDPVPDAADSVESTSTPSNALPPRKVAGVVLGAGGAASAGVGAGLMIHGLVQAQDYYTWPAGEAPYYVGLGAAIAGGTAILSGVLAGTIESTPVVVAAVDPREGRVHLVMSVRW
jgi:tetratricopeptide (TPR) repeat protein